MSLAVRDLRIGNLVDCLGMCKVVSIYKNKIKINRIIGEGLIEVEKIPLNSFCLSEFCITEQWLLDFGFDNLGEYGFGIGKFHMVNRVGKWGFPIDGEIRFIKYIHELQNLYFALTGNELKLKD